MPGKPTAMPADELHIASLVVHTGPRRLDSVEAAVRALPGTEVHGRAASGKLVVTLEADSGRALSALVAQIQHLDGVLSAPLVYQCADTVEAMNQEMPDAQA